MDKNAIKTELNRFKEINRYANNLIREQAEPLDFTNDPTAMTGETTTNTTETPPATGETTNAPLPEIEPNTEDDSTEEIDITDLVNMTKSIKQSVEAKASEPFDQGKMDGMFNKLFDMEQKLGLLDVMLQSIEELGAKIEEMKPLTPVEKLEMRSLDSGPFNQKPNEFFNQKQAEMRKTGKHEYVLTKNDVQNYSKNHIIKTFNPNEEDNTQASF